MLDLHREPKIQNKGFGKREGGVEDDSSFHLTTPENAVKELTVPLLLEHGTPSISVEMERVTRRLILDTGSNVSILPPGMSKSDVRATAVRPYGVTGQSLDIKGHQLVSFRCNEREIDHTFLVCSLPTDAAGCDFF